MIIKFTKDEMEKLNHAFDEWIKAKEIKIKNEIHKKNLFYRCHKNESIEIIYKTPNIIKLRYFPDYLEDPDTMDGEELNFELTGNDHLNFSHDEEILDNYFEMYCKFKNLSLDKKYRISLFKSFILLHAEWLN